MLNIYFVTVLYTSLLFIQLDGYINNNTVHDSINNSKLFNGKWEQ